MHTENPTVTESLSRIVDALEQIAERLDEMERRQERREMRAEGHVRSLAEAIVSPSRREAGRA